MVERDEVHMPPGPGELMFNVDATPPATIRPDPPMVASERETLRGWLDFHRATLAWKCDGLDDAQLKRASMLPSGLTLIGLVRHMAEVERHWFRRVIAGETIRHVWSEDWDFQAAYDGSQSTRTEVFDAWRAEIDHARSIEREVPALDDVFRVEAWDCDATLRTILLHLLHEYARHNGHADLLREGLDGTIGA
jgi:uncharacterized damage-inducible protein DinB